MTWMPGADTSVRANDGNSQKAMTRWDGVCVHTIVGYAPAPAAHFSVKANGHIYQHRSIGVQSAANYQGNPRIISIENEDHGPAFSGYWKNSSDVPPLTPEQVEANAKIIAWVYKVKGTPIVRMPNSLPTSRGVAVHRLGCDGNFTDGYPGRVPGGERWTTWSGKICPAWRRISQTYNLIIPRARVLAGLDKPSVTEWAYKNPTSLANYQNLGNDWDAYRILIEAGNRVCRYLNKSPFDAEQAVIARVNAVGGETQTRIGHARSEIAVVQSNVQEALDQLDRIEAGLTQPVPVTIDYDLLADKVAARLAALRFVATPEA